MFWENYINLIPFIIVFLGILQANFLIRKLISLRRSGWKPPNTNSKAVEEIIVQANSKDAVIDEKDTGNLEVEMHHRESVEEIASTIQEDSEQAEHAAAIKEKETEVPVNNKQRKWIQLPLPDIDGATIFEIMEGNEFSSTWPYYGHGFLSKVVDLYMCQGAELNDFRIAAGVGPKAGRMFNDITFQYDEEGKKRYCFVRVVKTDDIPTRKITTRDLKSSKQPTFSLLPLFESYVGIRQQFTDSGVDPSHIRFVTVFTNAMFDPSKFKFLDNGEEEGKSKSKISISRITGPGHAALPSNSYQVKIPSKKVKHYTGGDEVLKALFLEFLEKLTFAVNQPGACEIDEAIMDVLNEKFNLLESRFIYHEMLGNIATLPKQPTEKAVTNELKGFFQEIHKRLQRIYFSGAVLENHCDGLCNEDYFKTYEPILGALQARAAATDAEVARLICISTKTTALTTLKVANCLQRIYGAEPCFAVLDTLSLLKNKERVEDTFRCRREFLLAIKWSEMGAKMKAEVDVLVTKLIDMANNPKPDEKKTIILIEDTTKDFTDIKIYAETSHLLEDQCEFMNFRDEIKTQFMKDKFQIQGQVVALSDVITAWELKSLESRVLLLNRIIEDGQKCFASNYKLYN